MKVKNKLMVAVISTLSIGGTCYSQVVVPDTASGKRNNNRQDTTLLKTQKDTVKRPDSLNNTNKQGARIPEADTVIPPRNKNRHEIKDSKAR